MSDINRLCRLGQHMYCDGLVHVDYTAVPCQCECHKKARVGVV